MTSYCAPGRAEIARAVPPGSKRLRGQRIERLYLDALTGHPGVIALRPAARRNVIEVAKWLARRAAYADGTSWPTPARICERAGIRVSPRKAVRRPPQARACVG